MIVGDGLSRSTIHFGLLAVFAFLSYRLCDEPHLKGWRTLRIVGETDEISPIHTYIRCWFKFSCALMIGCSRWGDATFCMTIPRIYYARPYKTIFLSWISHTCMFTVEMPKYVYNMYTYMKRRVLVISRREERRCVRSRQYCRGWINHDEYVTIYTYVDNRMQIEQVAIERWMWWNVKL